MQLGTRDDNHTILSSPVLAVPLTTSLTELQQDGLRQTPHHCPPMHDFSPGLMLWYSAPTRVHSCLQLGAGQPLLVYLSAGGFAHLADRAMLLEDHKHPGWVPADTSLLSVGTKKNTKRELQGMVPALCLVLLEVTCPYSVYSILNVLPG